MGDEFSKRETSEIGDMRCVVESRSDLIELSTALKNLAEARKVESELGFDSKHDEIGGLMDQVVLHLRAMLTTEIDLREALPN